MLNETIFYSFRIHNKPQNPPDHLSFSTIYHSCKETKDRVIDLLNRDGIVTHEVIRPEIYKHNISFRSLPNFNHGAIHLIFKPFEYIRILKNAYNILVISWEFDAINVNSQNGTPFTNHYRMLSLLDEIWLLSNQQKEILNQHDFFNTYLVSEDTPEKEISYRKVSDRIRSIKRKPNE
jgi:hypothetical protein